MPEDHAHVVAPPPLIYAAALALGLVLNHYDPRGFLPAPWPRILGPIFCILTLVGLPALMAFRRAGTDPRPWVPAASLVVTGPYRFTRNPMYVGLTCLYLGVSFWTNALWALALLPIVLAVMTFGVIMREEAYLERHFGEPYRAYRSRVRRWL